MNEEESGDEEDESYVNKNGNDIKLPKPKLDYGENIRRKIRGKYLIEFENILKKKSATTNNRIIRGYLVRKKKYIQW